MSAPGTTPGPWVIKPSLRYDGQWYIGIGQWDGEYFDGMQIAVLPGCYTEAEADAHLIAASPALYDALEAELYDLEEDRRWAETPDLARIIARCERIERALAQARGEAV